MTALPDATDPLDSATASRAFAAVLDGACSPGTITAFLTQLADRGETADEIAAAATEMRARMVPVEGAPAQAIDVCGTGGDGQNSLNVSTAVSLVVAASGVPVAKHGNRAASSKAGAADTLEQLGVNMDAARAHNAATLQDLGIAFFFAQHHHPALGPLAPIRKSLGRRTIFNLLGPLCNPTRVRRQLIGVASPELVPVYAEAALRLNYDHAMIVSGLEGLDELSIAGPSCVAEIRDGAVTVSEISPADLGLSVSPLSAIRGGDAAFNANALRRLLLGEVGAYRDTVVLNAAAALRVAGDVDSWEEGMEEAQETLDKGLANALLNCWVDALS